MRTRIIITGIALYGLGLLTMYIIDNRMTYDQALDGFRAAYVIGCSDTRFNGTNIDETHIKPWDQVYDCITESNKFRVWLIKAGERK